MASNRSKVLTKQEKKRTRTRCVTYFSIIVLIVQPELIKFMTSKGLGYSDDPRVNLENLRNLVGKPKKRNPRRANQNSHGINASWDTLQSSRLGCNDVCHVNLQNVHANGTSHVAVWKKLMNDIGAHAAANLIERTEQSGKPYKGDIFSDPLVQKCSKMYSLLVKEVNPSLNRFLALRSLPKIEDPHVNLKRVVDKVSTRPTWFDGTVEGKVCIDDSFSARHAAIHCILLEIGTDYKKFLQAWMSLCQRTNFPLAAAEVGRALKKEVARENASLMAIKASSTPV